MNHYPRHVGDYIRDTVGLSMIEDGAYSRLLDQYYAREGALPADNSIYRIARAATKAERAAVDSILRQFFVKGADGYRQKRADIELDAQHERSESARKSAKRRWSERNANASPDAYANAMRTHSDGNASQKPVASSHKSEVQEQSRACATPAAKPRRAKQLPDDWSLPDDWKAWALAERGDWNEATVIGVSLLFRDHWLGKGEARADWLATWRNWVRREHGAARSHPTKPNQQPTLAERKVATVDAVIAAGKKPNGRDIESTSERVDQPPIPALSEPVREPDGDDVGSGGPKRSTTGVG